MARIFITGSSDGLGLRSAQALAKRGHDVYLHARNGQRAADARAACPAAKDVFVADLTSIEETKALAAQLNRAGPWDAVVHNAGIISSAARLRGKEGLPALFAVNTVAPYIVASLVTEPTPPKRHIFLSSSMHRGGDASLRDLRGSSYSDSKLHNILLAFWFARRLAPQGVLSNALDPGWVPTKMGGRNAPDDINASIDTYVLLAEGSGAAESQTGKYWYHSRPRGSAASGADSAYADAADDEAKQDQLITALEEISGVKPPQ
ncbi:NAD(P)-binding protein [Durotheca rogersii]|uniref:NAD(P)-binding protein n=1 Tax=Durotheca rogersii TaxID=419775 RepID=UPI00221F0DB0|nr:NAD(P)-binding protein [Durotheca rogersii]KAI5863571.1 NAD(P)-binding protein [Durotheca rogersii]